jgi:hypothetical protein
VHPDVLQFVWSLRSLKVASGGSGTLSTMLSLPVAYVYVTLAVTAKSAPGSTVLGAEMLTVHSSARVDAGAPATRTSAITDTTKTRVPTRETVNPTSNTIKSLV